MNEGAFIGSSQSAGDEAPVEETVPYSARDDQTGPKQGRVSSMVWELYTNEKDAHMKIACICQHCGHQIVHRKKSERAISHLLRCSPFLKEMMLLDPINRPDWFNNAKANKRKTAGARSSAGISQSSSQTGSILQYTLPKLMKRDLAKIEEALAMHYYLTGTAFSRIEEENLLSAFRICRPDIVLPDRKKLGGALLDSCYAKVKSVVDNHIEEIKLNACLTSDAWSNIKNEPIVNYMLISDSSTFFLESVSTGEQSHDAKWIAQDMGRVIDYLADESPTSKSTANREPTWLSAASSNAMGLLKGVFRKLEKKVNTFCTALFLPGTLSKEQASRKRVSRKSMTSLRTVLFAPITTINIGFLIWRCNWDRIFARSSVRWQKMTAFERTRVEDLIFDYDSETEQAQQMGKRESNVSSVHQFCDQGQSQQGSKGFSLPDVGKGNQDYPAVL
ncbi:hypothetical protein BASA61_004910, partial [Batrachochytrium salamandrivorans]